MGPFHSSRGEVGMCITLPGSGLPRCRAWPGNPIEGHHCRSLTARLTNCFLPQQPVLALLAALQRRQVPHSGVLVWGLRVADTSSRHTQFLPDPAQPPEQVKSPCPGVSDQTAEVSLRSVAETKKMPESSIRHCKSAPRGSQHEATTQLEGTRSVSPRHFTG